MMINHNSNLGFLLITTSLMLTACVTINIYFPAAAAEKVVDKIIDEVWQEDDKVNNGDRKKSESDTHDDKTNSKLNQTRP